MLKTARIARSLFPASSIALLLATAGCDGAYPGADQEDSVAATSAAVTADNSTKTKVVFSDDFNTDDLTMIGMTYATNTFRGTHAAAEYEVGAFTPVSGFDNTGAVEVNLGGIDNKTVLGMSGGWQATFSLDGSAPVQVSFRYDLVETPDYEHDEYNEVLMSIDGHLFGKDGNDYVTKLSGDGQGGPLRKTGWQKVTIDVGTLKTGSHVLTVGSYSNKKTALDEQSTTTFDDVVVTASVK